MITRIKDLHLNRLIPIYLMSNWLYYHSYECDFRTVLSDSDYDKLCKRIYDSWDWITHPHKSLVSRQGLIAGTGFDLPRDNYPIIIRHAAYTFYERFNNRQEIFVYD